MREGGLGHPKSSSSRAPPLTAERDRNCPLSAGEWVGGKGAGNGRQAHLPQSRHLLTMSLRATHLTSAFSRFSPLDCEMMKPEPQSSSVSVSSEGRQGEDAAFPRRRN